MFQRDSREERGSVEDEPSLMFLGTLSPLRHKRITGRKQAGVTVEE